MTITTCILMISFLTIYSQTDTPHRRVIRDIKVIHDSPSDQEVLDYLEDYHYISLDESECCDIIDSIELTDEEFLMEASCR